MYPYAGQFGIYHDLNSGLDLMMTRYYNSSINRFMSADEFPGIVAKPISHNAYAYVHNDPINNVDPDGHSPLDWLKENVVKPFVKYVVEPIVKYVIDPIEEYIIKPIGNLVDQKILTPIKNSKVGRAVGKFIKDQVGSIKAVVEKKRKADEEKIRVQVEKKAEAKVTFESQDTERVEENKRRFELNQGSYQGSGNSGDSNNNLNQWNPDNLAGAGNLTTLTAGGTETMSEAGKVYVTNSLGNQVRPNNIGIGTWNSFIKSEAATAESQLDLIAKVSKGAGYASVGIGVGFGIYDNVRSGAPTKKIISDSAVDTAFGAGGLAASIGAGALAGSVVPGAGTLVGAAVGLGVGLFYMGATEIWQPGGQSIKDRVKEGIYNSIK